MPFPLFTHFEEITDDLFDGYMSTSLRGIPMDIKKITDEIPYSSSIGDMLYSSIEIPMK